MWCDNKEFYNYLALTQSTYRPDAEFQIVFDCPSAAEETRTIGAVKNRYTLAANMTHVERTGITSETGNGWGGGSFMGVRRSQLKSLGSKLLYADGTGWFCIEKWSSNYEKSWDIYGDVNGDFSSYYWAISYRHNEGSNILFADSHVSSLKKEKIYNIEDPDRNDALWSLGD